jgi:hypothetical protein
VPEKLALHDVEDAAAFVTTILARSGLNLSHADWEDAHAFLVVECWRLSERYGA